MRLSFLLGSHPDHGPADSADGHAQNRRALSLSRAGCQQPFQRCEPLPVQLPRSAAPPAPLPKLGLAVGLGSGDPPMRAISATVLGRGAIILRERQRLAPLLLQTRSLASQFTEQRLSKLQHSAGIDPWLLISHALG